MTYTVYASDGRALMTTGALQYVRPEEYKAQRAAGCRFEVTDPTDEELAELARRGIKAKVRRTKCSTSQP